LPNSPAGAERRIASRDLQTYASKKSKNCTQNKVAQMRVTGFFSSFAIALLLSVPGWAADVAKSDLCAVSGVNGKVHALAGGWDADNFDSEEAIAGIASLSIPLGCALGLQIDAGGGQFGDASSVGAGGHLFMRDPSSYLIGIHATYEDWSFEAPALDVNSVKIGAEAELYLGNISLEAWAGYEDTNRTDGDVFGKLTAAFYATDDLRLSAGLRHANDFTTGVLGAEWQMPDMPLSLTAEAQFGEDDYRAIAIGAKFYFGADQKSLIDRHRQDDPDDGLFDFLGSAAAVSCLPGGGEAADDGATMALSEESIEDAVVSTCGAPPEVVMIPTRFE
jgi:hypothetical protein